MSESITMHWQSLLEQITPNAPQQLLSDIFKSTALSDKVELCYNNSKIHSTLKDWLRHCTTKSTSLKSTEYSSRYRENGNVYCRKKNHMLALKLYNKALLYAPEGSEELKSAYGNRSHVLLQINRYEDAIKDIDRALIGDKPTSRYMNLLLRKNQAYVRLGKYAEAKNVMNELHQLLSELPDESIKKKVIQSLEEMKRLQNSKEVNESEVTSTKTDYPNIMFSENSKFLYASRSLSLKENPTKGRYVVAHEPIQIGDVLFAERPFAFVVLPDMIDRYCSFCCKRIFAPVPCDNCPLAFYCNEKCRTEALQSFHSLECGGLEVCFSIGIVHLSLRVALLGLLEENKEKYSEVKNLVSHLSDLQPPDLFSYTITATLLTIYLENYTSLFKDKTSKEKLFDIGGTILLHIGQLVCNGHAITDMEQVESGTDTSLLIEDQVRVATAIYPSASMMNHSCKPNIINSFFDTLLVVRATENLNEGDEVFNCYGPMVYNTDFIKRQELLQSQYFFICDCVSCSNKDGPISDKFFCKDCSSEITLQSTICENCSSPVNISKLIDDLNESDIYYKKGMKELEKGSFDEAIKPLLQALKLREEHCHNHHKKLLECRDTLAQLYATKGHEEEAFIHLEKNVQGIESIYGNVSIELGQEIMKLLSIATSLRDRNPELTESQRVILKRSIAYGNKGLLIFKLSYGDWHPRFHLMEKHLNYLRVFTSENVGES